MVGKFSIEFKIEAPEVELKRPVDYRPDQKPSQRNPEERLRNSDPLAKYYDPECAHC